LAPYRSLATKQTTKAVARRDGAGLKRGVGLEKTPKSWGPAFAGFGSASIRQRDHLTGLQITSAAASPGMTARRIATRRGA